jgi:hypothetical protein
MHFLVLLSCLSTRKRHHFVNLPISPTGLVTIGQSKHWKQGFTGNRGLQLQGTESTLEKVHSDPCFGSNLISHVPIDRFHRWFDVTEQHVV